MSGRPVDPDEFARRLRMAGEPFDRLLPWHDGDDRCGCLARALTAVVTDEGWQTGYPTLDARHEVAETLRECVRNHVGWREPP